MFDVQNTNLKELVKLLELFQEIEFTLARHNQSGNKSLYKHDQ